MKRKKYYVVLNNRQRYPKTEVQTSEVVIWGPITQKEAKIHQKIIGRFTGSPLGFCFFVRFSPPFVRPHASNKILSTGKKKRVQSNGDGGQERQKKCWTRRDEHLSHRITHKNNHQESQRGMRGNTFFISRKASEGARQSPSTSVGLGICGRVLTCGQKRDQRIRQTAGLENWIWRSCTRRYSSSVLPSLHVLPSCTAGPGL